MIFNVCRCYNCGLTLKNREWKCPDCITKYERDINAAIDIKIFTLSDKYLIGI